MNQPHFIPPLNQHKPEYPVWTKYLIIGVAFFFGLGMLSSSFRLLKNLLFSGFQPMNFVIFASDAFTSIFLFSLLSLPALIVRHRIKSKHELNAALLKLSPEQLRQQEFGDPGANLSIARFGERAIAGREGEQRTAEIIRENILKMYPAARLINGISWPGTESADIDHALLIGESIILIDSKLYQPGQYYWDGKQLFRNGTQLEPFKVADALQAVKTIFPKNHISAAVVLHSTTGTDLSIELGKNSFPFPPALTANQLTDFLRNQASSTNSGSIYWQTLQQLLDLKK
ncbi:nuclease-related domain-containing protein [Rothia nasimurium]|uniref:nuclease-related domain-containing protein n=1 Tax=Rothia nasimurium TaxID=85336 RepID=UPI001F17BE1A|nr:nuclease-related domain-containing protein [Rothia nasimurium]